jgi:hypothetical protein
MAAHAQGLEVLKSVRATLGPGDDVMRAEQERRAALDARAVSLDD